MADTVSDVMTRNPISAEASQTATQAAQLMRDNDTGAILITDQGATVGILTDRDITLGIVAGEQSPNSQISQLLPQQQLQSVTPDTTLDQAAQIMQTNSVRRLPVLQGDQAIGMISMIDLASSGNLSSAMMAGIGASNNNSANNSSSSTSSTATSNSTGTGSSNTNSSSQS